MNANRIAALKAFPMQEVATKKGKIRVFDSPQAINIVISRHEGGSLNKPLIVKVIDDCSEQYKEIKLNPTAVY